jgi:hypothetical protein
MAMVTANWRKNCPVTPERNAIGTNTAHSTRAMAMIGPLTSRIAWCAAALGASPLPMFRSTFSTTTMASSTTMPMASTMPNKVSVLIEKPSACSTAKVPMIDTGTASSGMMEARQVCRNRMTTSTTSSTASSSVTTTALMESRTNTVGS